MINMKTQLSLSQNITVSADVPSFTVYIGRFRLGKLLEIFSCNNNKRVMQVSRDL